MKLSMIKLCIILYLFSSYHGLLYKNKFLLKSKLLEVGKNDSKSSFENLYKEIFNNIEGHVNTCAELKIKLQNSSDKGNLSEANQIQSVAASGWRGPPNRVNWLFKKNIGVDESGYFFDYLDNVLKEPVLKEFKKLWDEVWKLEPPIPEKYKDPFYLPKLLDPAAKPATTNKLTRPAEAKGDKTVQAATEDETKLFEKAKLVKKDFNPVIYKNSISAPYLKAVIDNWGWNVANTSQDHAKDLLIKYDFNGDGRLNVMEFILCSINANKSILGDKEFIYKKVINELIEPIAEYADCDIDEAISVEEIWNALSSMQAVKMSADGKLTAEGSKGWNMYSCIDKKGIKLNIKSVNDFVLKCMKSKNGILTNTEFIFGLLVGYWRRHVTESQIDMEDKISTKGDRWESPDKEKTCSDKSTA